MKDMEYSIFFVLLGWQNGEEGVQALCTDGRRLGDGWYVVLGDDTDAAGVSFASRDEAKRWAEAELRRRVASSSDGAWAFPLDGAEPYLIEEGQPDPSERGEANLASLSWCDGDHPYFSIELEGSYERLHLHASAPTALDAARVFAAALEAQTRILG